MIPGPVLGYQLFQTIAVTKTELQSMLFNHHPIIIIAIGVFSGSKNNRLCAEFLFSTQECSKSLTFPDNWWIIYPRLSSDWNTFSDFPWLFQFSLTWTNTAIPRACVFRGPGPGMYIDDRKLTVCWNPPKESLYSTVQTKLYQNVSLKIFQQLIVLPGNLSKRSVWSL